MDKMFTLREFVYFAKQFLAMERARLKSVYQEDDNHKKEIAAMLRRLDDLEEWFGKRCLDYLAVAATQAKWQEAAILCSLDRATDSGRAYDQIFAQKNEERLQIQKQFVCEQKRIEHFFDELVNLTLEIHSSAMVKFN